VAGWTGSRACGRIAVLGFYASGVAPESAELRTAIEAALK
jgi:hypothetical protein